MDTISFFKLMGIIATFIIATLRIIRLFKEFNKRRQLIEDLEILDKTPSTFKERDLVEIYIKDQLQFLYSQYSNNKHKSIDWVNGVTSLLFTAGLGYLTFYLSRNSFSLWSIIPGFLCIFVVEDLVRSIVGKPEKSPD